MAGWNDGTEKEIYKVEELQDAFSLDRITKSPAVFDKTKLGWMNGQHLRALPEDHVLPLVASAWQKSGLLAKPDSPFVRAALHVCQHSLEVCSSLLSFAICCGPPILPRLEQFQLQLQMCAEEFFAMYFIACPSWRTPPWSLYGMQSE